MKHGLRLEHKALLEAREVCHYSGNGLLISSQYRTVFVRRGGDERAINLPNDGWSLPARLRLVRRLLRLDKCNVVPVGKNRNDLVIIRRGRVYHFDRDADRVTETLRLRNCRNVLHQAICVVDDHTIFFGEYGANRDRREVPVYRSVDGGRSWETIYVFPAGRIKHVHGCYWDSCRDQVWVLTGDLSGECHILVADRDFRTLKWLGDGSQTWRACSVFFEADRVVWIMDSQFEDSKVVIYDRAAETIRTLGVFPGPVWYIKQLEDGYYLASTGCEIGPGVKDDYAHVMASSDLENWFEVARYRHDRLPKRFFKFGIISFADGPQTSESFYLFGEALTGLDGRVYECRLIPA